MNKFLRRILIYLVIVAFIGYATIYIVTKLNLGKMLGESTMYAMWKYKKKLINSSYSGTTNVIIGDSRAMIGFNPIIIGHNTLNLAISGTTPFEGYSVLKQFYLNNHIDTLIISFGIYHYLESERLERWTLPYALPSKDDINYLEAVERQFGRTIDNQKPKYSLYLKRKAIYFQNPIILRETFVENLKQNDYDPSALKMMAETKGFNNPMKLDSCDQLNAEAGIEGIKKRFDPNPVIMSYVDSIYNLSVKNGASILFLIPPINHASLKHLEKKIFWKQYQRFKRDLQRKYPRMIFDTKYESLPNTYFYDASHLNKTGAMFMSNYLKHKLDVHLKD
ncbi:MAG: hypothetical protein WKF66_20175 [Pedobacter sp.]